MRPRALAQLQILIVDDLEDSRWTLANLVRKEGFVPVLAASAEEALAHVRQKPPDVVLLDVRLPGMDGLTLLEQLKRHKRVLPVIMITGYANVKDAVRAVKAGAYDYLTKPFKHDEVVFAIWRALEGQGPMTDLFDEQDHLLIVAEVPGISQKDVRLTLQEDLLTLVAENGDKKYRKAITLPASFAPERMSFTCRNGVLEIKLVK